MLLPDKTAAAPLSTRPPDAESPAEAADISIVHMPSYISGLAHGVEIGRQIEAGERDAAWTEIARPIARSRQSFADLEHGGDS